MKFIFLEDNWNDNWTMEDIRRYYKDKEIICIKNSQSWKTRMYYDIIKRDKDNGIKKYLMNCESTMILKAKGKQMD